VKKAQ